MHCAFKFPDAFEVIDREKRFAAGSAEILKLVPIMPLPARGAFKVGQKHKFN
jgi:hypothetical protein